MRIIPEVSVPCSGSARRLRKDGRGWDCLSNASTNTNTNTNTNGSAGMPTTNLFCQNGEKMRFEFVIHWILPISSEYFYFHSIGGTPFQIIDEYFAMTWASKIQQNSLKNWHKGMMPWRDGRNVVMRRAGRILPPSTQNSIHLELTHQQVWCGWHSDAKERKRNMARLSWELWRTYSSQ